MTHKAPHLVRQLAHWKDGPTARLEPRDYRAVRLRKLHGYLGNISQVDHAVGELLDWLRKSGLKEDTIVVYSADHGDYGKKPRICSDAITRIPYIWRGQGTSRRATWQKRSWKPSTWRTRSALSPIWT